jgi:hypothetical protein
MNSCFKVRLLVPRMAWLGRAAGTLGMTVVMGALCGPAVSAPLATLDRNGSYVSIEAYAPNILRVTLSQDRDLTLAPPGYGFVGAVDGSGWHRETRPSGEVFVSSAMSLEVKAEPPLGAPSQMARYFAPSLPPVELVGAQSLRAQRVPARRCWK